MRVLDLGVQEYRETWALQQRLVQERADGAISDTLLLVEHPHVITRGRGFHGGTVPGDPGIPVLDVDRGGDATYHGPGQLVGYPIVQLKEAGFGVRDYLRALEDSLIASVAPFGVQAGRLEGFTGVWARGKKLASIGIGVKRWVSFHGFALNVSTDLAYFRRFYPCGLQPATLTSLEKLLGRTVLIEEAKRFAAEAVRSRLEPRSKVYSGAPCDQGRPSPSASPC